MKLGRNIYGFCKKHKNTLYLVLVSFLFVVSLFYLAGISDTDSLIRRKVPTTIICIGLFLSICKTIHKILKGRKQNNDSHHKTSE